MNDSDVCVVKGNIHICLNINSANIWWVLLCCREYRPEYERLHRELVSNRWCTSHKSTGRPTNILSALIKLYVFWNYIDFILKANKNVLFSFHEKRSSLTVINAFVSYSGWSSESETTGAVGTPSEGHGSGFHGNCSSYWYIHSERSRLCSFKKRHLKVINQLWTLHI